ncbi:hypothetical protein AVEN_247328-1 [Araneus ventricosus]|uniref:Uncharacterized protein n=1 Tax=Araneus ventricosus TaxID=182803 RepID=A0A4Y2KAT0_ARAVE|nr:hypothetical protein AVEN_247328-1 [Araneus ventricosus]
MVPPSDKSPWTHCHLQSSLFARHYFTLATSGMYPGSILLEVFQAPSAIRLGSFVVFQRCSSTLKARVPLKTPYTTHESIVLNLLHQAQRLCGRLA